MSNIPFGAPKTSVETWPNDMPDFLKTVHLGPQQYKWLCDPARTFTPEEVDAILHHPTPNVRDFLVSSDDFSATKAQADLILSDPNTMVRVSFLCSPNTRLTAEQLERALHHPSKSTRQACISNVNNKLSYKQIRQALLSSNLSINLAIVDRVDLKFDERHFDLILGRYYGPRHDSIMLDALRRRDFIPNQRQFCWGIESRTKTARNDAIKAIFLQKLNQTPTKAQIEILVSTRNTSDESKKLTFDATDSVSVALLHRPDVALCDFPPGYVRWLQFHGARDSNLALAQRHDFSPTPSQLDKGLDHYDDRVREAYQAIQMTRLRSLVVEAAICHTRQMNPPKLL